MANKYLQGYYTLRNPSKYIGDPQKVRFMSSWEFEAHRFFDTNARVVKWSSEPFGIPYIKPTDGKIHKYYVDYYCEYIDSDGVIHKELVELKPMSQVKPPSNRITKNSLYNGITYAVNMAKWEAAHNYCKSQNMQFRIITEASVFGSK